MSRDNIAILAHYLFFGVIVKIEFESKEDFEDFQFFYFDNYIPQSSKDTSKNVEITIRIKAYKKRGVIQRLMYNPAIKFASYKLKNDLKMKQWKENSTIIPPFKLPPLSGRFVLFHGAALVEKDDRDIGKNRATLVMAEHYQGKTSVTLSLLTSGRFKYLSEDLIPYEFSKMEIHPINKPGGIRYKTVPLIEGLSSKLKKVTNKKEYISHVTGDITVVKLNELFKGSYHPNPVKIGKIIFLCNKGTQCRKASLKRLHKKDFFLNLLKHRFNTGLPVENEVKECLHLARECEGFQLTYNLSRDLGNIVDLFDGGS